MGKTIILDIRNNSFPPLTIKPDTYVVWRNLDPYPHSAETLRESSRYFNAGALLPGETSSPIYFQATGDYEYLCRFHSGMTGVISVRDAQQRGQPATALSAPSHGAPVHDGHGHLLHFHGFVTGGRSGERLFMTHTPVIADQRHHFQVILQSSFIERAHVAAYDSLRQSPYGDGKVQIFHDHLSLQDIGDGVVTSLPSASVEYYPDGINGKDVPGLEANIPVRIDRVLHFHQFDPDSDYPDGLAYLVYGDTDDIFIDHYISRAPNFHSVAKLSKRPDFWTTESTGGAVKVLIHTKKIRDVSPKFMTRVGFVDNSFHVFWLPPPGVYPQPQDPLIPRDGSQSAVYDVKLDNGATSRIEIGRWLHFDVRLLNYGVLIT
jgi:hypothetical protein